MGSYGVGLQVECWLDEVVVWVANLDSMGASAAAVKSTVGVKNVCAIEWGQVELMVNPRVGTAWKQVMIQVMKEGPIQWAWER